jgi:hypothetical protein
MRKFCSEQKDMPKEKYSFKELAFMEMYSKMSKLADQPLPKNYA